MDLLFWRRVSIFVVQVMISERNLVKCASGATLWLSRCDHTGLRWVSSTLFGMRSLYELFLNETVMRLVIVLTLLFEYLLIDG